MLLPTDIESVEVQIFLLRASGTVAKVSKLFWTFEKTILLFLWWFFDCKAQVNKDDSIACAMVADSYSISSPTSTRL